MKPYYACTHTKIKEQNVTAVTKFLFVPVHESKLIKYWHCVELYFNVPRSSVAFGT